jgi:hypothetical protein
MHAGRAKSCEEALGLIGERNFGGRRVATIAFAAASKTSLEFSWTHALPGEPPHVSGPIEHRSDEVAQTSVIADLVPAYHMNYPLRRGDFAQE